MRRAKGFYIFVCTLLIAAAAALILPASSAQAADLCGKVNSNWTKAGNYSYKLTKKGKLLYRVGKGKEKVIAGKVAWARYHGSRVAYLLEMSDEGGFCRTPCRIFDCYKKKTVRKCVLKDKEAAYNRKILGFYNDNLAVTYASGAGVAFVNTKKYTSFMQNTWTKCSPAGGAQEGKYLVYVDAGGSLEVMDLSTGKVNTISKKGFSVIIHKGKLYYSEVKFGMDSIKKQTVNLYTCSVSGKGKKLLGSFKLKEDYWFDISDSGSGLVIIPTKNGAYIRQSVNGKYAYKALSFKTKQLKTIGRKKFDKMAKLPGLVAYGLTFYKNDDLDGVR